MNAGSATDWLITAAVGERPPRELFSEFCDRLSGSGISLLRAHLAMRMLHPLVNSVDLTWWRDRRLELMPRLYADQGTHAWLRSPLFYMLERRKLRMRRPISESTAEQFPVFGEFLEHGATDYFACIVPFGDPETAAERGDGVITSWLSDRPGGFTVHEMAALEQAQPAIALVSKLIKQIYAANNVTEAYLGAGVGARVLDGQIRLGDVERIPAVIWYSDMRNSTALAERLSAIEFMNAVNTYFACSAGAVIDHQGEVLRFVGDAVLGVFPIDESNDPRSAAGRAVNAARQARSQLDLLNEQRAERGEEALDFGTALHIGDVLFGNIGVPSRLEFSVIGSAVNETARLESLSKTLGCPVLVSSAFQQAWQQPCTVLGTFDLDGVANPMAVLRPD